MTETLISYIAAKIQLIEKIEENLMTAISNPRANYQHCTMNTADLIVQECDKIKEMLLEKNRKYGDSAINPKRIFSDANPIEQINVRIDDKLSRIAAGQKDDTEDAETDLIGYLILKKVAIAVQSQIRINTD